MDYKKIHDKIIENAISENRVKNSNVYYEKHHIIPRCMNGTNDIDNLILLTAKEHFILHKILCLLHPKNAKLAHALWRMVNTGINDKRDYRITAKEYERIKINKSSIQSLMVSGENNPMYGKCHSDDTKRKLQRPTKESTKKLISIKNKGKIPWNKGKTGVQTWSSEQYLRMKEVLKRPKSEEHKKKLSLSHTGKVMKVKTCEYCLKIISTTNYIRWHGNNCKQHNKPFVIVTEKN